MKFYLRSGGLHDFEDSVDFEGKKLDKQLGKKAKIGNSEIIEKAGEVRGLAAARGVRGDDGLAEDLSPEGLRPL